MLAPTLAANPAAPIATETPQSTEAIERPVGADGPPSLSVDFTNHEQTKRLHLLL